MNDIKLDNITISKKEKVILEGFSAEIKKGTLTGIISDDEDTSTLTLKAIAGLYFLDSGNVLLDGEQIHGNNYRVIEDIRKKIAFVFSSGGLLSNLSVIENLLLPFDYHYPNLSKSEKIKPIQEYFDKFSLPGQLLNKRPSELSAILTKVIVTIRSWLFNPGLILYDLPFNNLNYRYQKLILEQILEIAKEKSITQIFTLNVHSGLLDYADDIFLIKEKKLVISGTWNSLIQSGNSDILTVLEDFSHL